MASKAIDVKKLRQDMGLSQAEFAERYGFNVATLRDWEQGRSSPDKSAATLLSVISHSPETVSQALASGR